jgi:uncharacterized protein YneF (UPF0154 family)
MKNSWLFIMVFMILGSEVILLYSAKNIIDKAAEDNPPIQQEAIQPVLPASTFKVDESVPQKSSTNEIKHKINFDFVMPNLKPDVPDILNQKLSFLKAHPDFIFWIKRIHGEGSMIDKNPTGGALRAKIDQVYLVHQGTEKKRVSSINYDEVNHD